MQDRRDIRERVSDVGLSRYSCRSQHALCNLPRASFRWLRTGDEVMINERKDVFVVDRIKELIKVRGFQVAPSELEGLLLDHPDVVDVCVVPVQDDFSGERPFAFVVPAPPVAERVHNNWMEQQRMREKLLKVSDVWSLRVVCSRC